MNGGLVAMRGSLATTFGGFVKERTRFKGERGGSPRDIPGAMEKGGGFIASHAANGSSTTRFVTCPAASVALPAGIVVSVPADDPTELFDLCDPDGRSLERTKERGLVHRDGDWHRSVHLWVVLASDATPAVLLQRRSLAKDSHPGKVDVSVAGHRRAGERGGAVEAALREAEEEAGLALQPSDLARLGTRWHVHVASPVFVDREIQDVFLAVTRRALEALRPDADEVFGLLSVPLDAAIALATGGVASVSAREIRPGDTAAREVTLREGDLVASSDGYFGYALRSIERRLRGEREDEWAMRGSAREGSDG